MVVGQAAFCEGWRAKVRNSEGRKMERGRSCCKGGGRKKTLDSRKCERGEGESAKGPRVEKSEHSAIACALMNVSHVCIKKYHFSKNISTNPTFKMTFYFVSF